MKATASKDRNEINNLKSVALLEASEAKINEKNKNAMKRPKRPYRLLPISNALR